MKPKNFPHRRQQRRIEALERQKKYNGDFPSKYGESQVTYLETIISNAKIGRTKKDRSSRAPMKSF